MVTHPVQAADHPRSRGVYPSASAASRAARGSSPLARGLPGGGAAGGLGAGIIPARAGFTRMGDHGPDSSTDHPRSRGVYLHASLDTTAQTGSSPLARGLPSRKTQTRRYHRIIPARAGFTAACLILSEHLRDHPRSRGVYRPRCAASARRSGSSPLARGLPGAGGGHSTGDGIIPARAGFTVGVRAVHFSIPDHPRSRGVYRASWASRAVRAGSSPLARGLPLLGRRRRRAQGIIPARAGFTARTPRRRRSRPDHPRSRGVYWTPPPTRPTSQGSSPLARGLRVVAATTDFDRGIIPARAGFTTASGIGRRRTRGSSPLARGLPGILRPQPDGRRIIPARAGFTS